MVEEVTMTATTYVSTVTIGVNKPYRNKSAGTLARETRGMPYSLLVFARDFLPKYVHSETQLSKTATCGPVITGLYREVAALQRWIAMI